MPDDEDSAAAPEDQYSVPAPDLEGPAADDYREALAKSLLWVNIDDEQRLDAIAAEVTLGDMRRRTLPDWLRVGKGIAALEQEVICQANADRGKRYNQKWRDLAPAHIRDMDQSCRSNTKWLWLNREAVQTWWNTVPADRRDRWGHPSTIKLQYEKAHRPEADDEAEPDAEDRPDRQRQGPARQRRAAAAALDESAAQLINVIDRADEVMTTMELITGSPRSALIYDLSTEELASESAFNFWQVYHAVYGDQGARWFIAALIEILERSVH
jgi:hypothetical protein